MNKPDRDRSFLLFLLIASAVLVGAVVWPLASALFLALVLAVVLWPLHEKLALKLKGRRQLSASLFTFGLVVALLVPLLALSAFVVSEGGRGAEFIADTVRSEGVRGLIERLPPGPRDVVHDALNQLPRKQSQDLQKSMKDQVAAGGTKAAAAVGSVVAATGMLMFHSAMMLIAFFFFLVQGNQAIDWVESVSPLRQKQTRELIAEFRSVSYALVVSTIVTCAVQSLAALIGYVIASVPHPVFFAGLTFFVAFIPAVGAGSVCMFAALLLLVTGHTGMAIFLGLWAVFVVALVDNLVKPMLIQHDIEMPGAVVFFSLMGGLAAFGGVGLLIGPLATAFFITLVRMYRRETSGRTSVAPAP